ncbi:MAG: chlorite dismutase family protein [Terriglobales bacterium]
MGTAQGEEARRQVVTFTFYKVMPEWRKLPEAERRSAQAEFADVLQKWARGSEMTVLPYCAVGLRSKFDFFLWRICYSPECLQSMHVDMVRTQFGGYLVAEHSMLGMTRRSQYKIGSEQHRHAEAGVLEGGKHRYLTVFPYVKTRNWYQLPFEERQRIVREFMSVPDEFPRTRMNTLYSFGIDDQDFIVILESDHLSDFVDMQMRLRETQNSSYTERVTPVYCGLRCTVEELMEKVD